MADGQQLPSPESLLALSRERRSIRRYRPDPVPEEMVAQLIEAGRWAPSAGNRQPWAFILVQDEAMRRQLAQHAAYYFIRWAHVDEAPLIIVLCGDARNSLYRQFLHEDIGLAGSQIMLQAKALGLGTCWIGGLDRAAIGGLLRVPSDLEIVGLITVGFPAADPPATSRKSLAQVTHYETYGNRDRAAPPAPGSVPGGPLRRFLRRLRIAVRV